MTTANERYNQNVTAIYRELAKISDLIEQHHEKASENPADWQYAGDASYVLGQLQEVRQFLDGTQP